MRVFALALTLLLWALVWWCRRRGHAPPILQPGGRGAAPSGQPLVSIILPARNEAGRVEHCVRSLLAQDYARFEVIAIDDCSDDGTGGILRQLAASDDRLTVIGGEPVPEGRMGKAYAIVQGFKVARGDWLLFTDADTTHAPWLLGRVMASLADSPASFATVFAAQRHPGPGVYLVNLAVLVYLYLAVDFGQLLRPDSRQSLVNGQYVIVSRQAYEAIGTHAAIARFSSTDTSLGYLAKLQGWMPLYFDGRHALTTTMYRSAGEALAGWSRSLVSGPMTAWGRRRGSVLLAVVVAAMVLIWIAPWLVVASAAAAGDRITLIAGALGVAATVALMRLQAASPFRPHGGHPAVALAALAMPVSCAVFAGMALYGLAGSWIRGGTVWKGRVVRCDSRLPPWRPSPARPRPTDL